jgi:hypothetical protein
MALKKQPDWSCIAFTTQKYLTRSIKLPLQQGVQCTRAGSTRAKETQRGPSILWLIGYLRLQRGSPSASDTNPSNRILAIPAGRANKAFRQTDSENPDAPARDDEVPVHAVGNRSTARTCLPRFLAGTRRTGSRQTGRTTDTAKARRLARAYRPHQTDGAGARSSRTNTSFRRVLAATVRSAAGDLLCRTGHRNPATGASVTRPPRA